MNVNNYMDVGDLVKVIMFSKNLDFVLLLQSVLAPHKIELVHRSERDQLKVALSDKECLCVLFDAPSPSIADLSFWQELMQNTAVPVLMLNSNGRNVEQVLAWQRAVLRLASPLVDYCHSITLRQGSNEFHREVFELAPHVIFDVAGMRVLKNEEHHTLSGTEFKLLYLLANNRGRTFNTQELLDHLDLLGCPSLYVHIKKLREKIEDDQQKPVILINRRGLGYEIPEVKELVAQP